MYSEKHIQVLSEIEHIRKNPGMYIGETETPSKLLDEILDNAIDELPYATNGFTVIVDYDRNEYTVQDTGRGIPIGESTLPDGSKLPTPVLIASKLFSSGKFSDKAYEIAAGLHGVGLVAVNALSEYMYISIRRNKQYCRFTFRKGEWIKSESFYKEEPDQPITGTTVTFKPDPAYFVTDKIPLDHILERLGVIKLYEEYENQPVQLIIIQNGKRKDYSIKKTLPDIFKGVFTPILHAKVVNTSTKESIEVYVSYDKKQYNFQAGGAVNVIPVNAGSHISYAKQQIKKVIQHLANKYKREIQPDDYQYGLRLYVLTKIKKRQFTSQSKEKLSTPIKYFNDIFNDKLFNQLLKQLEENDQLRTSILDKLESYRLYLSSKDVVKSFKSDVKGQKTSRGLSDVPNLKDCLIEDINKTELFIVEGESAGGTVLSVRDPNTMGVLLLKGKVINTESNKLDRVFKNKEIQALMKALGTGIGKDFDISKLRYGTIWLFPDRDVDGKHIACLLITALASLVPDLLKTGRIMILEAPLYGVTHKKTKKFIPIYNFNEWLSYDDKEYYKHRFKGLGEMNPNQMKAVLDVRHDHALPVVLSDKEIQVLKQLMVSPQLKKQLLLDKGILKEW